MKIGIVGLGSIGRRHVNCLLSIGVRQFVALRTRKGALKEQPSGMARFMEEVGSWDDFMSHLPDGVIVANPTALHIKTLKKIKKHGIPVFVEKPLASTLVELADLEKSFKKFSDIIVGYCMRFHPVVETIKTFIQQGLLGKIYKGRFYFGNYLPNWHPGIDYRLEYMSRKDLGGGVLRTIAHEIDMVQYLLGTINSCSGYVGHTSHLELDNVDDTVFMNCFLDGGGVVLVELDYLSPDYLREGYIIGEKGKITYSFNENKVTFRDYLNNEKELLTIKNYNIDDMYRRQMLDFISWIKGGRSNNCNYQNAKKINELIEELENGVFHRKRKINFL